MRDFIRFGRGRIFVAIALMAVGTGFEAVGLLFLASLLHLATAPQDAAGLGGLRRILASAGDADRQVLAALLLFTTMLVLRSLTLTLRDGLVGRLQFGYVESAKLALVRRLAGASWRTTVGLGHGRVVQTMTADLQQLGIGAHHLLQGASSAVTILGISAVALWLAPWLVLSVATLGAGAILALPLMRRVSRISVGLVRRNQVMADSTLELLDGLKVAKAQGLEARYVAEFAATSAAMLRDRVALFGLQSSARNLWLVLAGAIGVATAALGLFVLGSGPTMVMAVLLILSRVTSPAIALHQGLHHVIQSAPAFAAVRALRDEIEVAPPGLPGPIVGSGGAPQIALDGVHYAHDGKPGLEDVSLVLAAGRFFGVSGPSGAGKSTFVDLVAGLLEPQSGAVLIDGAALAGEARDAHRAGLGYTSSEAALLGDTVRRCFILAAEGATDGDIWHAARLTGADEVILGLAGGLDAAIGPRGRLLSAGERQRLALACALARKPRLLILDEATSALDIPSEAEVLSRLSALLPRPTILMVAHRPQALRYCDTIIRVHEGRIAVTAASPAPALLVR